MEYLCIKKFSNRFCIASYQPYQSTKQTADNERLYPGESDSIFGKAVGIALKTQTKMIKTSRMSASQWVDDFKTRNFPEITFIFSDYLKYTITLHCFGY